MGEVTGAAPVHATNALVVQGMGTGFLNRFYVGSNPTGSTIDTLMHDHHTCVEGNHHEHTIQSYCQLFGTSHW